MRTVVLFILSLSLGITQGFAQAAAEVAMQNYTKANALLTQSITKSGGLEKLNQATRFDLIGTKYFFGHFDTPEKSIPVKDTSKIAFFPAMDLSYLYSTLNYRGDRTKIIFQQGDSTRYFGYFSDDFTIGANLSERNQLNVLWPAQMLLLAHRFKKTLAWVGEDKLQQILAFNDLTGTRFNFYLDKSTGRLNKVTQLAYHELYGDYLDVITYEYSDGNTFTPNKVSHYERGLLEAMYQYQNFKPNPIVDSAFVKAICPTCTMAELGTGKPKLTFTKIDEKLGIIALEHLDNKVLLAEFESYLVVFEAPRNVEAGKAIIAFLKEKYPNKPIKYLAVSHHHPDHAGGLNAFVDIGASIITTPGNQAFFNKLLNATHTLKAENGMKAKPASFKMVPPKTAFNLTDPSNSVKIIEAGEGTDHVKEFLFFYFPQQKLLFVGDLVLFPEEGVMDQSQRALSVHNLIKTQQLNVEKIYTSWPLHNQKTYGSMEDLKASLAKNYPDLNK
jgi:hypothetical protein